MKKKVFKILALTLAVCLGAALVYSSRSAADYAGTAAADTISVDLYASATPRGSGAGGSGGASVSASASGYEAADTGELFTARDLEQSADLSEAVSLTVSDGQTLTIPKEGVYVLSGTAKEAVVLVDADGAKVQLVLKGLNITNSGFPCVYVKNADKVFVTTVADSSLTVNGSFTADGDTNTDGAIFSKDDLVLNGTATLTVRSSANGVVSKDDLKITGGSYVIRASAHALEARDSIRVASGSFSLTAGKDALHAENDEDASLGYIVIADGSFVIQAADDGIHARSSVQIDGGSFSIQAAEGVESTCVLITGGTLTIKASDDGINAAQKSSSYRAAVEITGGEITIEMGAGDTDGVDSNGDLRISGGLIRVTGGSCFDVDGSVSFTGGTVSVNGQQVSSIPVQSFGGMSGMNGGQPGGMGGGRGFGGGRRG